MSKVSEFHEETKLFEQVQQLQITQAYQEESIESLEKTVAQQHQEIQHLQHQLTLLSEFLKNMKSQGGIKRPEEEIPPPHY